jgi:hypothetical protein
MQKRSAFIGITHLTLSDSEDGTVKNIEKVSTQERCDFGAESGSSYARQEIVMLHLVQPTDVV